MYQTNIHNLWSKLQHVLTMSAIFAGAILEWKIVIKSRGHSGATGGFEANSCVIAFVWRANTGSSSVFSGFDWVFRRLSRFWIRQRSKIYTHVGTKGNFWFSHVNLRWIILALFKRRVLRWLTSCWVVLQWYVLWLIWKTRLTFFNQWETNQNQSYGAWAHFPEPVADAMCSLWIDWTACCAVTPVGIAQSNFSCTCFRSRQYIETAL